MTQPQSPPLPHLHFTVQTYNSLRRGFFNSPASALLSLICLIIFIWLAWLLLRWALIDATFSSSATIDICRANGGACWSVIANRWRIIFFGLYPHEHHWRSALACLSIIVTVVFMCIPTFWRTKRLIAIALTGFLTFIILMKGGVLGLSLINEGKWGGLSLTLFIFSVVSLIGMPLAIALALLRNSSLPLVAKVTGGFIDTIRALPMLTLLFTFAIVMPFVLPNLLIGERLYRVIFGLALYFAVYQAEIIRGGMQGVGKGQNEAACALGLPYRYTMGLIILPQAFRIALPATINQFVVSFMETSLVTLVGFFDLLASGNAAYRTGEWRFAFVEIYVFVAAIYFFFVFGLSRYGAYIERKSKHPI